MGGNRLEKLYKTEDWWSVWMGLGLVLLALGVFWGGGSIQGWAVTPAKWSSVGPVLQDLVSKCWGYGVIYLIFAVVFALSMAVMGHNVRRFLAGFTVLFLGSLLIFLVSGWKVMEDLNVEAPLLALLVGLVISNLLGVREWFKECLCTEYYIKVGIVLLGATLPLTLIFSAGPIAFLQATIVSVVTWMTIYFSATRIFKLEPKFGAVLGAAGAVCGVSASIAVGGAVKAKKDHISIAIAVVTVWAIVMILFLTILLKFLVPHTLSPGVAGAWVGNSEFADAAGLAVVAELAQRFGDAPINAFTLMKVIGRDIWIGIWCLILSVVSVIWWEEGEDAGQRVGAGIIWERFPKFVLGFLAASVLMSVVASKPPAGRTATVAWKGSYRGMPYDADFSSFTVPDRFRETLAVDREKRTLSFRGTLGEEEMGALEEAATPDQARALDALRLSSDWFESVLTPKVISPVKKLRSWAFVLCFLCIGLSTRFKDLATFGLKPFWAFTIGVLVNVPLGFVLSAWVFAKYWMRI
jgi:uncharacterized membrane protein YadS